MTSQKTELTEKAHAAAALVVGGFGQLKFVENILQAFDEACRKIPGRDGLNTRIPIEEIPKRLLFELTAFAAFIIMGQEIQKHLVRSRLFLGSSPDEESIYFFNGALTERIGQNFQKLGISKLREMALVRNGPAVKIGFGEKLEFNRRISEYLKVGAGPRIAKVFGQHINLAVDPDSYPVLVPIGMKFIEPIVELIRLSLKSIFDSEEKRIKGA